MSVDEGDASILWFILMARKGLRSTILNLNYELEG